MLAQTPAVLLVEAADPKADEEIVDDKVKFLESIKENNLAKVEECLRNNALLVNAAAADGWTGLHFCATKGFDKIAQYLIENNADLNSKKKDGNTPLHNAAMNNNVNMIQLLIKCGAKLDCINVKKQTALQIAMQYNHNESVAELESYERAAHEKFLSAIDDNIKSIKFNNAVNADEAVIVEIGAVSTTNSDIVNIQDDDSIVSPTDDITDTINIVTSSGDSNNWVEKYSVKYQRKYWKNIVDNTTSWNDPFKPTCNNPDYEVVYSATYGRYYFRHKITKEKTWDDPSNNNSASTMLDANEILNTATDEGNYRETKLDESVEEDNSNTIDEKSGIQPNATDDDTVSVTHRKPPPPPIESADPVIQSPLVEEEAGKAVTDTPDAVSVTHRKPPPPPAESVDPVTQAPSVEEVVEKSTIDTPDAVSVTHRKPPPPPAESVDPVAQAPSVEEVVGVTTNISGDDGCDTNMSAAIIASDSLPSASDNQSNQSKRRPPSKMKFKAVDDEVADSSANSTSTTQSTIEQTEVEKMGKDTNGDSVAPNKVIAPMSKKEQDKLIAEQAMAAMRKKREEKEKQNNRSEE